MTLTMGLRQHHHDLVVKTQNVRANPATKLCMQQFACRNMLLAKRGGAI